MYGIAESSELFYNLSGRSVGQISFGPYDVTIRFDGGDEISFYLSLSIASDNGEVSTLTIPFVKDAVGNSGAIQCLIGLVGVAVAKVCIHKDIQIVEIYFCNGCCISFGDCSKMYESVVACIDNKSVII
jgi:hypothetical protein